MDVSLAFDVSTSVIGWAALPLDADIDTYPSCWGHIDLRKVKGGFWQKVDRAFSEITSLSALLLSQGFAVRSVYIEDPLKKFTRGRSSADTISLLARFNAVVSYETRQIFSVEPLYIDATHARKKIGIPLLSKTKSGGASQKKQTFSFLSTRVFLNEAWPRNKNGKIQPWCYDAVDAFVICVAGCQGLGKPA